MDSSFVLAVHALVLLSHKADILTSDVLAENICTHPGRVRRIMATLRTAGLVESKRGGHSVSGYSFSLNPGKVSLRRVAEALNARFASTGWRSGDSHMDCRIASGIAGVMDGIYEDLNQACLARLEGVTIKDINRELFAAQKTSAGDERR